MKSKSDPTTAELAVKQALAELGIHASLGDIVTRARSIENEIAQSGLRSEQERLC